MALSLLAAPTAGLLGSLYLTAGSAAAAPVPAVVPGSRHTLLPAVDPRSTRDAPRSDALQARVRGELAAFTSWLSATGAQGFIGEVGWPNDYLGEAALWSTLADAWYRDADAAGLWVTAWDANQRRCDYKLAIYKTTVCGAAPLARLDSQAPVFEAHGSTSAYRRGINVVSAVDRSPYQGESTSSFSNRTPGVYGVDYVYDDQSTFDYLAGRGVTLVRLGVRWERLQPALGAPLDALELARLTAAIDRVRRARLAVILDLHNDGAYYLWDGTAGVRRVVGSPELGQAHLVDLWLRLSDVFAGDDAVVGYGLMNEPAGMGPAAWESQSQAVVSALRGRGDRKLVLVPGTAWAGGWSSAHPRAWIADPAHNLRYEAHQYFDRLSWGTYDNRYADELRDAEERGYTGR